MYRLEPLFRDEDTKKFKGTPATFLVSGDIDDKLVAMVPPTTTMREARKIEEDLTKVFERPVVVLTSNIVLCRFQELMPDEVAAAFNGQEFGDDDEEEVTPMLPHATVPEESPQQPSFEFPEGETK